MTGKQAAALSLGGREGSREGVLISGCRSSRGDLTRTVWEGGSRAVGGSGTFRSPGSRREVARSRRLRRVEAEPGAATWGLGRGGCGGTCGEDGREPGGVVRAGGVPCTKLGQRKGRGRCRHPGGILGIALLKGDFSGWEGGAEKTGIYWRSDP